MTTKFNLGDKVKDTITGLQGTITSYTFHLSGCHYCEIELPPENGDIKTLYYPEERYELVEASENGRAPDISECHVQLGNEVKDVLTGYKGHATLILAPLYGYLRIAIDPGIGKDGKLIDALFFDECRVEVIKAKPAPVVEQMPEKRKTRGANPTSAARYLGR